MKIVRMTKTVLHSCSKDEVKPILHKFKLKFQTDEGRPGHNLEKDMG